MRKIKHLLFVYFDYNEINYTPLDIAYILSYLRQRVPDIRITVLPILAGRNKRMPEYKKDVYQILGYEADTVVFFLDNILWSGMFYEGLAAHLARQLKQHDPTLAVGFQSYKIRTERSIEELKKNPEVDFILRDDPELPFLDLCTQRDWSLIRGVTYRQGQKTIANPDAPKIQHLDELPSPYLSGFLDSFIEAKVGHGKIAFFMLASRGCPYRCHYCFRSVKFSEVRRFSPQRVVAEMRYLQQRGAKAIVFLDDTFVGAGEYFERFLVQYSEVFPDKKSPVLYVMTRPELLTPEAIKNLAKINVRYIQLGIQTINPDSQYLMGRSPDFTPQVFREIARNCKKAGIRLHYDCIFGLPGDSLDYFRQTLEFAVSLRPWRMQVKQLYLNPDTLFDIRRQDYGIILGKALPRNVPLVKSCNGWRAQDIKTAYAFAQKIRRANPSIKFKIVSEYGYFNDFNKS